MEENRKELMEILEDTRPEIDFEKEKALIDDQLLDSLSTHNQQVSFMSMRQ